MLTERPGSPAPAAPGTPIRVLLVEDDTVDRMAFERLVERESLPYECASVATFAGALEKLAERSYDVVVSDYRLGDGTALDLLGLDLDAPVIVITGLGDEELAVQIMRAGAYDYLTKDFHRHYLKMVPVTIANACHRHASERKVRMLSQALTCLNDGVYITDLKGRLLSVNATFCRLYGYAESELVGRDAEMLWAAGGRQELAPRPPAEWPEEGERGECLHRRRDGREIAIELTRAPIVDEQGRQVAVVGVARDLGEKKRFEHELRVSEERYALAAAGANDGLWDWDLQSGQIYYSPRWKLILGYEADELEPRSEEWLERVHPEDLELLQAQLDAHLEGRSPHFENEHRVRTRSGEYRWVQARGLAVRDARTQKAQRVAGSLRDVTDRKRIEEQLTHSSLHDSLTGLPNRVLFLDRLAGAILHRKRRDDYLFGVIFLDLDRFKVINESLGHLAGDRLLRAIARRLESCLRLGDTVARLGGDEFAVLVDDLDDAREIDEVAERIHAELQAPFTIEDREFFTSASLGIALGSADYERPEEILRDADTALFKAKSNGRGDRVLFHKEMHADAVQVLHLETDLRRAVERRELRVFYQPIIELRGGTLAGFEALIRWQHPRRGLLGPGDFLQAAHDTGLMESIGWWVLGEACRQMKTWRERFPDLAHASVSVNLDGRQLSSFELVRRVDGALEESQLVPAGLKLEITEGMIIENPSLTAQILAQLRDRGIGLHIDDFGTGYSSLSQLHRFPIDALKIDRSFVLGMSRDDENLEIVRTIIALARTLGLEVMGEGVESLEQLVQLRALGCELAQGYMFARPLHPQEIEDKLESGSWMLLTSAGAPIEHGEASGVIDRLSLLGGE